MSRDAARTTAHAVQALWRTLDGDGRLHAEMLRAARQFLGHDAKGDAADPAEHRFVEWFALERDSDTLGAVPAELPAFAAVTRDLRGSTAGVFEVTAAGPDGVEARDLQDGEVLDLQVPARTLQRGDLLVGRLFPADAGWVPSTAAAVFRPGAALGAAFARDLQRLALGRRLQQIELEHLLLRRPERTPSPTAALAPRPLEHLEADLDALLRAGGCRHTAAAISERLAAGPRLGPALGPLLDELAFETRIDLDRARELLLQVWNAHHPPAPAEAAPGPGAAGGASAAALDGPPGGGTPPADETLGARLVRKLDEGLARRRDVDEVFAELERLAGLAPGACDADEEDDDGSDAALGGDLGPLVDEYLWETGSADGPAGATLRGWVELQRNAPSPRTDLEQVSGQDLLRFLLHVWLDGPPAGRAPAVRAAFATLGEFAAWALRTQEIDLAGPLAAAHGALVDQLDRLAAAGAALSAAADATRRPELLRVEDVGPLGCGVCDDDGEHHWLALPPAAAQALRAGDLLLGALLRRSGGASLAGPVVVLPAAARPLME